MGSLTLIPVLLAAWLLSVPWLAAVGGLALAAVGFDFFHHEITLETALAQTATVAVVAGLAAVAKENFQHRRRTEEMANHLAAQQEQHALMQRAKTRFLLTISHDLRTPLTVVRGYLAMLEDGDIPDSGLPRALHTASLKAAELEDLIKRLLEGFDPEGQEASTLLSQDDSDLVER